MTKKSSSELTLADHIAIHAVCAEVIIKLAQVGEDRLTERQLDGVANLLLKLFQAASIQPTFIGGAPENLSNN